MGKRGGTQGGWGRVVVVCVGAVLSLGSTCQRTKTPPRPIAEQPDAGGRIEQAYSTITCRDGSRATASTGTQSGVCNVGQNVGGESTISCVDNTAGGGGTAVAECRNGSAWCGSTSGAGGCDLIPP